MFKSILRKISVLAVISGLMVSASANSVGFTQEAYGINSGGLVSIAYDFSDFPMFGGGFDLIYDPDHLIFISYTQAELPADAQEAASPIGNGFDVGIYSGAGIGTFEFMNGMSSSGIIGTFLFDVIGGGTSNATPCGQSMCLVPNAINPFVSLAGDDVTADLFANGISGAGFVASEVPVPAAMWFLLSGVGALLGLGRKRA